MSQGDTSTQVEECPGYPNTKRLFGKQKENKRSFLGVDGGGQKESDVPYHTTQEGGNVKWETRHVLKNTWMSMV